jgi:hypothetical protein
VRFCLVLLGLPEVTGHPLPEVLAAGIIDPDLFRTGYAIMAARYEELGIRALLPLERVWAGTCSAARLGTARGHGGFHHPAQGYRHVQMDAAVTVFGDLTGHTPVSPQAAALDLVRSYAHPIDRTNERHTGIEVALAIS